MKNPKDSKKAILENQWTVTLHPLAERELQTIPADMQARFLHIGEMLEELGPQRVGLPFGEKKCGRLRSLLRSRILTSCPCRTDLFSSLQNEFGVTNCRWWSIF